MKSATAPAVKLAWRMLVRDARAGELRILLAALVIAVASVTSVGFFADRIGRALHQESHQLIGADFVVSSDRPIPAALSDAALQRGLRVARAINFPSMASAAGKTQLAGFKAVSDGYPLRGTLRTSSDRNQPMVMEADRSGNVDSANSLPLLELPPAFCHHHSPCAGIRIKGLPYLGMLGEVGKSCKRMHSTALAVERGE